MSQVIIKKPANKFILSASQYSTYKACPRKWGFSYILNKREPSSSSQTLGKKVHADLEKYIKNKIELPDSKTGKIASAALDYIYPSEKGYSEETYYFECDGFWYTAVVDLFYPSKNTVIDFKTSSNFKWAMDQETIQTDSQAIIYSKLFQLAEYEGIKLRWIYLLTKGKPEGITLDTTIKDLDEKFEVIQCDHKDMRKYHKDKIDVMSMLCDKNNCYTYNKKCHCMDFCHEKPIITIGNEMSPEKISDRLRKLKAAEINPPPITQEVKEEIACNKLLDEREEETTLITDEKQVNEKIREYKESVINDCDAGLTSAKELQTLFKNFIPAVKLKIKYARKLGVEIEEIIQKKIKIEEGEADTKSYAKEQLEEIKQKKKARKFIKQNPIKTGLISKKNEKVIEGLSIVAEATNNHIVSEFIAPKKATPKEIKEAFRIKTLYVDCIPYKGNRLFEHASKLIKPYLQEVEKKLKTPYYRMVDYRAGSIAVANKLRLDVREKTLILPTLLFIDTLIIEKEIVEVLTHEYETIIRRI